MLLAKLLGTFCNENSWAATCCTARKNGKEFVVIEYWGKQLMVVKNMSPTFN